MRSATAQTEHVRSAIRTMRAYSLEPRAADDELDQNESPFDFPDELKRLVFERVAAREWNRYPDFELTRLRTAVAGSAGLHYQNVLVGNGSNELLLTTLGTFVSGETTVIVPRPSFPLFEKLVTIFGGQLLPVGLDLASGRLPCHEMAALARSAETPVVIIVCSPNNPTGGALQSGELEGLLATGALVVLDRAYGDFVPDALPPLHERLVTLSTFSKAWGLAGLRIGWLATTEKNASELRKVKLPYSLNLFSEEAALVALQNRQLYESCLVHVRTERERLSRLLSDIGGIQPFPSSANFICFRVPRSEAVFDGLLEKRILIRDVHHYPGMDNCLRVSIGSREENDRFVAALRAVVRKESAR